jgi:hypothetical protein
MFMIFTSTRSFSLCGILMSVLLLSGCTGLQYGISEEDWQSMSLPKTEEIQKNFQRIKEARQADRLKQESLVITPRTPKVQLTIEGGKALMPPYDTSYTFYPVKVTIYQGECQTVTLLQRDGQKSTPLEACYRGKVVYVDPSRYEFKWLYGSLQFHYVPIWQSGFKYENISSKGYAALKNVTIKIKAQHVPS